MTDSLILKNGRIYPLNGIVHRVEALSIRGGRVLRLGPLERVREGIQDSCEEIDLEGRTVVPSFSDHLGRLGREAFVRTHIDLSIPQNIPEIFAIIEQHSRKREKGEWIVGFGWNKSHWGWHRFPHRADLDLVAPHHPVALFSSDHRVAWLNSAALQRVGVRHDTPNPPGGEIERDPTTRSATGILKESAIFLVTQCVPPPDPAELEAALKEVYLHYLSMGMSTVQSFDSLDEFELLRSLPPEGLPPIHILSHVRYSEREQFLQKGFKGGDRQGNLWTGGFWLAVDGTLLSQTAHLLEPYADDWNKYGIEAMHLSEIQKAAEWCLEHGFALGFHASGDAACRQVIDVLTQVLKGRRGIGPMIVNGDLIHPDDLAKVARIAPILCTNPRRILSEEEVGKRYWGPRWERALDLGAWKENGATLHFGSGEPLRLWSPMQALAAAVSIQEGRSPSCSLTVEQGLVALCRLPPSLACGELGDGFLSPGQPANLAVLSEDPFSLPPSRIGEIAVDLSILGGQRVYDRLAAAPS